MRQSIMEKLHNRENKMKPGGDSRKHEYRMVVNVSFGLQSRGVILIVKIKK